MGVGSFTSTPTRNYKVVHSFVRPFLFQTFQTSFSFNADMSSTMSGHSPKAAIPIEQKLRYANAERGTRNFKLQTLQTFFKR